MTNDGYANPVVLVGTEWLFEDLEHDYDGSRIEYGSPVGVQVEKGA